MRTLLKKQGGWKNKALCLRLRWWLGVGFIHWRWYKKCERAEQSALIKSATWERERECEFDFLSAFSAAHDEPQKADSQPTESFLSRQTYFFATRRESFIVSVLLVICEAKSDLMTCPSLRAPSKKKKKKKERSPWIIVSSAQSSFGFLVRVRARHRDQELHAPKRPLNLCSHRPSLRPRKLGQLL